MHKEAKRIRIGKVNFVEGWSSSAISGSRDFYFRIPVFQRRELSEAAVKKIFQIPKRASGILALR